MKWQFNCLEGTKNYHFKAEVTWTSYQIEDIKVTGDGISVVLQNNRPLLVAIESKLPVTWRVIQGEVKDPALLVKIKKELESYLKKVPVKSGQEAAKKAA